MVPLSFYVLCAGLYINTFVFGITIAFGSLFDGLTDKFQENVSMTSAVQAILIGVSQTSGLVSGVLFSRMEMWKVCFLGAVLCPLGFTLSFMARSIVHLYVFISCITGAGVSILFVGSTVAVGRTFSGSRALLALSVQHCGINVGVAVIPYILDLLLDAYGINGTFLVLGGFYLNCLPVVLIYSLVDKHGDHNNSKGQSKTHKMELENQRRTILDSIGTEMKLFVNGVRKVLNPPFLLNLIAVGTMVGSMNGFFSLVVDILTWKGFTKANALSAYSVAYCVGLLGRLIPGILKQVNGVSLFTFPVVFGMCGLAGLLVILCSSQIVPALAGCGLTGVAMSGILSSANMIVVQLVEKDNVAIGVGLFYSTNGIFSMIIGPLYGAIKDTTQVYTLVLYMMAGFQVFGSVLSMLTVVARQLERSKHVVSHTGCANYAMDVPDALSE